jgi:hypothetical protein
MPQQNLDEVHALPGNRQAAMNPLKECIAVSFVLVGGMVRMETGYSGEAKNSA